MTKKESLKLFNDKKVRTVWDDEQEKWYFSVVDVIDILTDSPDPKRYWSVLKSRIKKEGLELTTICSTLKLRATDGKMRLTAVSYSLCPRPKPNHSSNGWRLWPPNGSTKYKIRNFPLPKL